MTYLLPFLNDSAVRRVWRIWANLPESDDETLDRFAQHLRENPLLQARLAEGESRLFADGLPEDWGEVGVDAEIAAGLYTILGLLSIPRIVADHSARGIDTRISRATCEDIGAAVAHYRRAHGVTTWGVERWLLDWWRRIASGDLYRLGRLEYQPRTYQGVVIVLRHRKTRAVVALSCDGILYDAEGYAVTDALNPPPGTWKATLYEDADSITGSVVPPTGLATRQRVCLSKDEWKIVFRPGDAALDVHIPAGLPLDCESSRDSLATAVEFFLRKLPERHPVAFICHSWLLDPAWQHRLDAESRITQWARQAYGFPVASGTGDGLYFIFARFEIDPHRTPVCTRLEQQMRDAVLNGEPLRSGGMFLLVEDASRWGQEPYRANWPDITKWLTRDELSP